MPPFCIQCMTIIINTIMKKNNSSVSNVTSRFLNLVTFDMILESYITLKLSCIIICELTIDGAEYKDNASHY